MRGPGGSAVHPVGAYRAHPEAPQIAHGPMGAKWNPPTFPGESGAMALCWVGKCPQVQRDRPAPGAADATMT